MQPILLGVNIDHVATLRQARLTSYPDPIEAAGLAEAGGADGITLHLREDRRHIQERDVERLLEACRTKVNLEMAVTSEMLALATRYRPQDCCLVPERRQELTTEGGLDVAGQREKMHAACQQLAASGIRVSLFIDADPHQIEACVEVGAPVIEIHTGHFADAKTDGERLEQYERIRRAVSQGVAAGLQVNAGHGLHYENVQDVARLPEIAELNIGHAIVARALFVGMRSAVHEMKERMTEARRA